MQDLRALQTELVEYLLNQSDDIKDYVADGGPIDKKTRLHIYGNAYRERLRGVIDTDHEILSFYLGDDLFNLLVSNYIDSHPSTHTSLRDFCKNIPKFLSTTAPFKEHPILSELARFEHTLLFAFDANDSGTAQLSDLQHLALEDWPKIQLRFHPSVQIFETNTNCVEIWQAMKKNVPPPTANEQRQAAWIVWRNNQRITEFTSLTQTELLALNVFLQGGTLSGVCEELLSYQHENEVSQTVVSYIQKWLERKQIARISISK